MWLRKRENIMHIFSLNLALSLNQPFFFICFSSYSILFGELYFVHSTNCGREMISPSFSISFSANEKHNLTHKWDQLTSNVSLLTREYFKSRPFQNCLLLSTCYALLQFLSCFSALFMFFREYKTETERDR